jgi:DNA-binding response OmpR family regulator
MTARKKILIVDDDAFIRRPLEFILRQHGYEAITACDGEECLQAVESAIPDLIFLDVAMPGLDGFGVCRHLKADSRYAGIPVVLLSARGEERDRETGLAAGAIEFMTKPYSPKDLIRRVEEILSESGEAQRVG